jgi:Ca2+/Na+ antiporter
LETWKVSILTRVVVPLFCRTHLKQIAKATAFTFPLTNTIEEFIVSRFKQNAAQVRRFSLFIPILISQHNFVTNQHVCLFVCLFCLFVWWLIDFPQKGREIMENAIELVKRERELAQQRLTEQTRYFDELTDNLKENFEQSIDNLNGLNGFTLELNLKEDN